MSHSDHCHCECKDKIKAAYGAIEEKNYGIAYAILYDLLHPGDQYESEGAEPVA